MNRTRLSNLSLLIAVLLMGVPAFVSAQTFKAGEVVEYKRSWGDKWERGVFIRLTPSGKQAVIHEKPNPFFPEGSEASYDLNELRKPGAAAPAAANTGSTAGGTLAPAAPKGNVPAPLALPGVAAAPVAPAASIPAGAGLLSKEEVIAYAKAKIGPDPWKNPPRDANLADIRDFIRGRGTSFTADDDFRIRMDAQSSNSSHIGWAVNENRGPHPTIKDYMGAWLLRAANRGSRSAGTDSAGRATVTTTDSQAESGQLTINADGTYVWKPFRNDPESKWLKGRWREVMPDEAHTWEGGPAIWLIQAKQGYDYMVRKERDPAWPGWINVGMGKGRTPVEYGRRP
jgi:hypothetical protein